MIWIPWSRPGLALAIVMVTIPAQGSDDPRGWLDRMGYALEYLNYEGTLVQMQGADAAVMRVVHRVESGVPTERITAMDETGREIIRRGEDVTCILPDQQAVLVDRRGNTNQATSPLREQFSGTVHFDDRYYRLAVASGGSLVGRETHLVTVRPTDGYRYGYRLWLDRATAMPLKVQIAGDDDIVVEQLLFSDISLPDRIPASSVQPSVPMDRFTWRRSPSPAAVGAVPVAGSGEAAWTVTVLPPGFRLRAVRAQRAEPGEAPLDQLVYSDGVASVSVFIEAVVAAAEQGSEGPSHIGAANAYTTVIKGHLVTAVGEVPVRTVEVIARSVQPAVRPEP
ncbi:MAG: MucB/RseB C-terminal domain-containing protein [Gammaproteobacteria bacterium]|nr:MucB/RseB C-terminal domain-containing protein [Gammaproteobacteria bacterium]